MRALPILALTLLATTGCTAGASYSADGGPAPGMAVEPELARMLEGRVAGEPRSCLSLTQTRDARTFRGTIVYRTSNATFYRNDFNGCPELNTHTIPVFSTPTGLLCSGEIVQLIDRSSQFPIGACSVGKFVPYTRVAG